MINVSEVLTYFVPKLSRVRNSADWGPIYPFASFFAFTNPDTRENRWIGVSKV